MNTIMDVAIFATLFVGGLGITELIIGKQRESLRLIEEGRVLVLIALICAFAIGGVKFLMSCGC